MKYTLIISVILTLLSVTAFASNGSPLREAKLPYLIEKSVLNAKYLSGDKSWNGGMYSSAYIAQASFDSNTAHAMYSISSDTTITDIPESILKGIAKEFQLPISSPSSIWKKQAIEGTDPEHYSAAFLSSYPYGKHPQNGGEYITVEVSRTSQTECSITVTYVSVRNE